MIGWLMSSVGAGSVVMILLLKNVKKHPTYGWKLGLSFLLLGLGFGYVGLLQSGVHLINIVIAGLLAGFGNGILGTTGGYILQKEVPSDMVGRVNGIFNSSMNLGIIIAPILGGVLIGLFGARLMFQLIGAGIVLLGILVIVFQRILWKKPSDVIAQATIGEIENF